MTSPNGQFLDLNAQRSRHPNIVKLRSGDVRRNHPEPDRTHVEGHIPTAPAPIPSEEPEPVAAKKKKRTRLSESDKNVALARVAALVAAGEEVGVSCKKVAKEFGASHLSLARWRKERANGKSEPEVAKKKRAGKKAPRGSLASPNRQVPPARDALATEVLSAFAAWLDAGVREVVRQEIRRMLA